MRKTVLGFALALLFLVSGCAKKTSTSPSAAGSDSVSASPSAETSSSPSVAPESYAISYQVVGQGNVTLSKSSATAGETITATAVSGADYHFVSLTSDDVTLTEADTAGTYTFVMPGKAVSLVATFAVNQEYELLKLGVFNLEDTTFWMTLRPQRTPVRRKSSSATSKCIRTLFPLLTLFLSLVPMRLCPRLYGNAGMPIPSLTWNRLPASLPPIFVTDNRL
jgi:hypothetical protein